MTEEVFGSTCFDQRFLFYISTLTISGQTSGVILFWTITIPGNFFQPKSAVVEWAAMGSFSASSEG